MPIAEISIVPVGTKSASISFFVIEALKTIQKNQIKHELTSMGTNLEGSLEDILRVTKRVHESAFKNGALRVITTLKIDDRKDRRMSMKGRVESVLKKAELK